MRGQCRLWAALRASSAEGRFEALHATGLTALVGREEELELLVRRWSRAKTGEGQVVLLSGEAGIGKSRLTAALLEHLATEPHTRLRYFCSPQHTDSAFYPIIGQMERAAGFAHDDTPQAQARQARCGAGTDLDLPPGCRAVCRDAVAAERWTLSRARPSPGAAAARNDEGAHCTNRGADAPDTRADDLRGCALDRPHEPRSVRSGGGSDRDPPRTADRDVPPGVRAAVDRTATRHRPHHQSAGAARHRRHDRPRRRQQDAVPASIRQDIIERTDGIPLFVEEMTKAVLEAESEGEARRTAAAVPSPALAVPASLHASLMARLDRLGPAKEVAQIGAAIGREFSHALLAAVMRKPEAELRSALDRLIAAGLLFRQGVPPHATYLFKHALVRDAAYGTLLREPRRALHARIAETLESQFAEIAESQPELLARHCTEAGLTEKAAGLWGKAGQRSLARAALLEGAEQLKRALDQIATLPATPALRREEIKLEVAFANALALTGDFVDGKEHYDRALAIYDPAEHRPLTTRSGRDVGVALLSSRSSCVWLLGYPAASRNDAERAVKNARETGHATTLMFALHASGFNHICCGNYAAANAQVDELIALADERGAPYWKATGTAVAGLAFCTDRKSLGCSSGDHLGDHLTSVNWSNSL